jgi:hypothetical protein
VRRGSKRQHLPAGPSLALLGTLVLTQCSPTPAGSPAAPDPTSGPPALTPVLSIRELMTHVIDPTADWIFDAAVVDVSPTGTQTTMPDSDEAWLKVERGALMLAEASNLLKMPRPVAPPDAPVEPTEPGTPSPELSPADIQTKIDQDRSRWHQHADQLRVAALASLTTIKARDTEGLFKAGNDIDNACEGCHLEYWYPGDKHAVEQWKNSTATFGTPKK